MALTLESLKPIFPKYDYKYTNSPREACSTYLSGNNPFNLPPPCIHKSEVPPKKDGLKLTTDVVDWRGKSRGLFFHYPQGSADVVCAKLSEECKPPDPVICRERTKTRCTQTRYRESSAQTRSFQPQVSGDKENYQDYEVYLISKLLDTHEPPGEYEAKVVERFRRRRQYQKALQVTKNQKEKHNAVLEAMEWEDWVAREEDIQGCQMLRMEAVLKMFEEREKNLCELSEKRMTCSAERIQGKRAAQLKKINVEFSRGMRRLEAKHQKITRGYRKGNITQDHIDRASDLHAPQMRFGVNPNRRHFVGFRKNFDDRINDLDKEKDERGLASLICPFSKLRSWAKPKERMKEVSQRFCTDVNLKNLYESLKRLRSISEAPKAIPKCLKRKIKSTQRDNENATMPIAKEQERQKTTTQSEITAQSDIKLRKPISPEELTENLRQRRRTELDLKTEVDISNVVGEFEGTILGSLLSFLSDELQRLNQQKKFHAIHMLAQRERWRREAYEAGVRQNENKFREENEVLYNRTSAIHKDTASMFLESILEEEFNFNAEALARDKIVEMAKDIDQQDLQGMRTSGRARRIYDLAVIGDYVQNQAFAVAEKRFAKMNSDKLQEARFKAMEVELFADVERALAIKYQVPEVVSIVDELLNELIDDAVTYDIDIFTPSTSNEDFEPDKDMMTGVINKLIALVIPNPDIVAEHEAVAIIRKIVRRVIPEERWKDEGERIIEQTLSETFNNAIYEVECLKASTYVRNNDRLAEVISEIYSRFGDLKRPTKQPEYEESESEYYSSLRTIRSTIDIFERPSDRTTDLETPEDLTRTIINYIDTDQLEKCEPQEVGRRHERFDITGTVAKRYRHQEKGGENKGSFIDIDELASDESTSSFNDRRVSREHLELTKSRIISALTWRQATHPELKIAPEYSSPTPTEGASSSHDSEVIERQSPY